MSDTDVNQVSKGMAALRLSNRKVDKISVEGTTFCFRRLTINDEKRLDDIIKGNMFYEKPPTAPEGDVPDSEIKKYTEAVMDFQSRQQISYRRLAAALMKFVLVDESGKLFFNEDDDVYSMLDNKFAEQFNRAFRKFRGEDADEAGKAANADTRFQK